MFFLVRFAAVAICLTIVTGAGNVSAQPAEQGGAVESAALNSIPAAAFKQRSLAELRAGLNAIAAADRKSVAQGMDRERQAALTRLKIYRFLCYLPQDDLTLDPQLNDEAFAAADICRRLGKLSHAPDNPGLPDAEYQRARDAAGKCSLAVGEADLVKAIDLWMDDSDEGNLARLGHRRWCLNPQMSKLGLGPLGAFCAMWTFDRSRVAAFDYDFISFPPPGFVPVRFFDSGYAWSITLNPARYLVPEPKAITVELFPMQNDRVDRAHSLEIEHQTLDTAGFGVSNCLIFRPKGLTVRPSSSYQLTVRGLQTVTGQPAIVDFPVRFVDMREGTR